MKIQKHQSLLIFAITCFLLFASQYSSLRWSSFSGDDTHIMQLALSHGWFEPYFKPEIYQQLSIVHYTPVVLSIYLSIIKLFGLNVDAFVGVQILSMTVFSALAGFLCCSITRSLSAGFFAIILIYSNDNSITMLSRFYTVHYIVGGIFALLALLLVQRNSSFTKPILVALFSTTFLALMCKEVYLMLVPLLWILLLLRGARAAAAVVALSLICYLALRIYSLGFSGDGRSGHSFIADVYTIDISTWSHFAKWYLSTRWLIVVTAALAMAVAPRKQSVNLLVAAAFALPVLAAPHAIRAPELHGDRLVFIFDSALVVASVMALYAKPIPRLFYSIVIVMAYVIIIPLQRVNVKTFSMQEIANPSYHITNTILYDLVKKPTTVLVPLYYGQGELMNIYRLLGNPWLSITQNCQQALAQDTNDRTLVVFNFIGKQVSNETLSESCRQNGLSVAINVAPEFRSGLVRWDISAATGYSTGVLLIDRGFAIPVPKFSERLVRPRPRERYQLFANKENQWWFSDIKTIDIY